MFDFNHRKKTSSDGVSLLASILVCHAEIASVSYEPKERSIDFSFNLKKVPTKEEFRDFAQLVGESLETYSLLEGSYQPQKVDFTLETQGGVAFFHIVRDLTTLVRGEINLMVKLVKDKFGTELVRDRYAPDRLDEEFAAAQEEVLEHVLLTVKDSGLKNKLVGIREEGRVVVFDP